MQVRSLRATDGCADSERSASPSTTHDHLALSSALRGAAASQVLAYYANCYDPSTSGPVSAEERSYLQVLSKPIGLANKITPRHSRFIERLYCSPGGILVHSKLVLGIGPARAASVQPRSKSDIQATDPHGGAALAMAALLVGGLLNQRGGVLMIGVRGALSPPHHAWLRSPPTSTS